MYLFIFVFIAIISYGIYFNATSKDPFEDSKKVLYPTKIVDMGMSTAGYTVPWAMSCVEEFGKKTYKINPSYEVFPESEGTLTMIVRRSEDGKYHAYPIEKIDVSSGHWMNGIDITVND
ncbi:MAG: hypothetical protein LiPW41_77 [Parcubacteria group bacterium LiPW_41]|nr:MAG: hypothetical protein LiPW41_77 [Parcubacteria group bacterium LiPW_41]